MSTHTNHSPRHLSILRVITKHQEKHRNTPTYEEIAAAIGMSKGCVASNIQKMVQKGILKRIPGSRRSITIPQAQASKVTVA
jgi:DNA-binding MarR family transcriptional regulator